MDYVRGPCAEHPVDQLPRGRPPHRHGSAAEGEGEEPPGGGAGKEWGSDAGRETRKEEEQGTRGVTSAGGRDKGTGWPGRRRMGPNRHRSRERWAAPARSTCARGWVGEGDCTPRRLSRHSEFWWMTCGPIFYVGPPVCLS